MKSTRPGTTPGGGRRRAPDIIAAALLVLGAGNVVFGVAKSREHRRLLDEGARPAGSAAAVPADPFEHRPEPRVGTVERGAATRSAPAESVRARIDFYRFVALGGKAMIVCGTVILLLVAAARRATFPGR